MTISIFRTLAAASVLAISAASAQAVTISFQGDGAFNGNGGEGATVTSIADPVKTVKARAGGFALKGDISGNGEENFTAWCLDILNYLGNGKEYVVTDTPFVGDALSALQIANIGRLFNTAYAGLNILNNEQSAGFQFALWEIIYENPANAFDLKAGNLWIKSTNQALDAGQAFLNNLAQPATGAWNLVFLQSDNSQDLVTATPVPVPAAAGLLLLALGGLGVVGRRRQLA